MADYVHMFQNYTHSHDHNSFACWERSYYLHATDIILHAELNISHMIYT